MASSHYEDCTAIWPTLIEPLWVLTGIVSLDHRDIVLTSMTAHMRPVAKQANRDVATRVVQGLLSSGKVYG